MSSEPPRKRIRQIAGQSLLSFERNEHIGKKWIVFLITFFKFLFKFVCTISHCDRANSRFARRLISQKRYKIELQLQWKTCFILNSFFPKFLLIEVRCNVNFLLFDYGANELYC